MQEETQTIIKKLHCYNHAAKCPVEPCSPACPYYTSDIGAGISNLHEAAAEALENYRAQWEDLIKGPVVYVPMSKVQCKNLAEFIEFGLLDEIRKDNEIDNLDWVGSLYLAMSILKRASEQETNP